MISDAQVRDFFSGATSPVDCTAAVAKKIALAVIDDQIERGCVLGVDQGREHAAKI
jgi:hypothetical protein